MNYRNGDRCVIGNGCLGFFIFSFLSSQLHQLHLSNQLHFSHILHSSNQLHISNRLHKLGIIRKI